MPMLMPMGMQGFDSKDAAKADARRHLYAIPFCVLAQKQNYGWVTEPHASKLLAENKDLRLVGRFDT